MYLKMGQAIAYDTKEFLPILGIALLALTAACTLASTEARSSERTAVPAALSFLRREKLVFIGTYSVTTTLASAFTHVKEKEHVSPLSRPRALC